MSCLSRPSDAAANWAGLMGNVMHRGKGSFTFVENTIFFDHGLSAKAKGIYCQIRSLENNPEWVFTVKGFASLVRDGADAVSAGIKELESSGYIIRARKRSENGRFLKAEEATWITLDDPAMHAQVAAELKADGYAILSEFTREPPANVEDWKQFFMLTQIHTVAFAEYDGRHDEELEKKKKNG